jgi:hypothetical protein
MGDVTFYPQARTLRKLGWNEPKKTVPLARDVMFSFLDSEKLQRGIICRCYAGQHHAVTARESDRIAANLTVRYPSIPNAPPLESRPKHLPMWPADSMVPLDWRTENADFIAKIWDVVPRGPASSQGLIVVAGETASQKTTYAREIARRYVSDVMARKDPPHVVTYEDPIESWFAESPQQASESGFMYTPRQKGTDVQDLDKAVTDALRQKPALLYVNEIRSDDDWRSILFFAGTGHLAVTTTHAGSLVETFARIFRAMRANSAAARSEMASRIVAIVHVRKLENQTLVPAVWIQTARSRMALTQEGLGSLLPSQPPRDDAGRMVPAAGCGCYGRAYFAGALNKLQVFKAAVKADLAGE